MAIAVLSTFHIDLKVRLVLRIAAADQAEARTKAHAIMDGLAKEPGLPFDVGFFDNEARGARLVLGRGVVAVANNPDPRFLVTLPLLVQFDVQAKKSSLPGSVLRATRRLVKDSLLYRQGLPHPKAKLEGAWHGGHIAISYPLVLALSDTCAAGT